MSQQRNKPKCKHPMPIEHIGNGIFKCYKCKALFKRHSSPPAINKVPTFADIITVFSNGKVGR